MLTYPEIDPIAFSLGPLAVRWYGLMYLIGFAGAWWLARWRAKAGYDGWTPEQVDDLVFYTAVGVVLGGRLGYVVFYDLANGLAEPLRLLKIWQGGMSFHGGLIGVLLAMGYFARRQGMTFFKVTDFIAPVVPIGLGTGRIGNFINAELWGRTSDVPWAMVFPGGGPFARHPSQLYQAFLEGLVLFLVLWFVSVEPRARMLVSGLFLLLYGVFRFAVEFVRVPDAHLGFVAWGWLTMGQLLSVPMILIGAGLVVAAKVRWQRTP